jgi:IS5 family transposase
MEPLRQGVHQHFGGFQSKMRSKVEQPYQIMKRVFGFTRIRYRGLVKNTHRVQVTCALVNLFLVRKQLLKPALAME